MLHVTLQAIKCVSGTNSLMTSHNQNGYAWPYEASTLGSSCHRLLSQHCIKCQKPPPWVTAGLARHRAKPQVRGSTLASHQETFRVISEIKWYHGFLRGVRPWGPVAGMIARLCHVTQWLSTFWSSQSCSATDMRGVCLSHAMAKPYAYPFIKSQKELDGAASTSAHQRPGLPTRQMRTCFHPKPPSKCSWLITNDQDV